MEVVESLCDRVGILNKGTLVAVIDLHELREQGKSLEEIFVRLTSQNDDGTGTTAMPAQTTDMEESGEKAIETTNPSQKTIIHIRLSILVILIMRLKKMAMRMTVMM